ncbi:hypothetical protein HBI22_142790 [Parastagonospora nodorum]|nr:hypothetical protein HBI22_142790 [Parastagonospora nodorum]
MINGYGRVEDWPSEMESSKHGYALNPSGQEGLDWNLEWIQQAYGFDRSTACIMNYLWRVSTGGDANSCTLKCE